MKIFSIVLALSPLLVDTLGTTDTITSGGDNSRAGYQPNHNMDPDIVGSSAFGQIWRTRLTKNCLNVPEQIFSQPLVFTPNSTQNDTTGSTQYVYIATTTNAIYKIDAKTGQIIISRILHVPFLAKDLDGCTDLQPCIGVTGTGTIDPATGVWYLTSKTYIDQTSGITGRLNSRYYAHAIDVNDLSEKPGFPISFEGLPARNNPKRSFISGNEHQRTALVLEKGFVYAGFASHCGKYNYTGWIIGWNSGGKIVESFTTQGGSEDITTTGGGVWMSGGGISSDGYGSLWLATGNGYASQLHGITVSGRQPPSALEEAAVHLTIGGDGSLSVVDFFMPFEKEQLDGADKDLGTSPLVKLPESTFSCANIKRIGVVTGKSGKTYFLNLDDLGGYQTGRNHGDNIIFAYQNQNSVYSGAAVYPLEGGYVYIHVIQFPTNIFRFSCDSSGGGTPVFTYVGQTADSNARILGVGHGTTTSLNGRPGTGLVWVTDVQGYNLRVYKIVENRLLLIKTAQISGVTKFTRPVLGDGRAYIGTTEGYLYAFGSPTNIPVLCSTPVDFGTITIGNISQPRSIQCKANITTTINSIEVTSVNFNISNLPMLPFTIKAGENFSFIGIFKPVISGPLADDIFINTTNSSSPKRSLTTLTGIGNSLKPLLAITPNTVSFEGAIVSQSPNGIDNSVVFINQGSTILTVGNISWSQISENGPFIQPNVTTDGIQLGPFTFKNIPVTIAPQSQIIVNVNFNPQTSGNFATYVQVNSDGGSKIFTVVGTSGTNPKARLDFLSVDASGWIPYSDIIPFTFGDVYEQVTTNLQLRLTNIGGPSAGRLSVTVSKPPITAGQIIGARNNIDLGEGTILQAGESVNATMFCSVPKSQVNIPDYNTTAIWTMNTGDPDFGKRDIQFYCHAIAEQVGPLKPNGSALFPYIGCYKENNPDRQLDTKISSAGWTIDYCIKQCNDKGYKMVGLQYRQECWCSNIRSPILKVDDGNCNFYCSGNQSQICGGNGVNRNGAYISLFAADRTQLNISNPSATSSGPPATSSGPPATSSGPPATSFGLPAISSGSPTTSSGPPATSIYTGGPSIPQRYLNWSYTGCYTEIGGRALVGSSYSRPNNTVEQCANFCRGYFLFGVEYGAECYCSNNLKSGSVVKSDSDCNKVCPADKTEYCGASNRIQLYTLTLVNTTNISTNSTTTASTTAKVVMARS